jgi:hypothetical protein
MVIERECFLGLFQSKTDYQTLQMAILLGIALIALWGWNSKTIQSKKSYVKREHLAA